MCIFPDEEKERRSAKERSYSKKSLKDFSQLVNLGSTEQYAANMLNFSIVFECFHVSFWLLVGLFCNWQMSDHWHCICTGWTQPLRALSPCHDSRGGGGSWHHISAALAVSAWTLPYGKGRHGQACTLKYPVTMGREEWEREWKSSPSVLPITPTAWWTSWESILSAYSAAAAVRRQSCV